MAEIKQLKEKKTDEIFYPVTVGEAVIFEDGKNLNNKIEKLNKYIETTYSDLKSLRDNSQLIPGALYRITDYVTTTVDPESRSMGHLFDVIVLALDNDHLSEEAYATHHEGDTYFANSNLHAWKLMYCIDNDTTRFEWADPNYGKGVIYQSAWTNLFLIRQITNGTIRLPDLAQHDRLKFQMILLSVVHLLAILYCQLHLGNSVV